MSESIQLAFYHGKSEGYIPNFMLKMINGKYVHVEIVFEDEHQPGLYVACSVAEDSKVFYKPKSWGRRNWEFIRVSGITKSELQQMKNFCYTQAKRGSKFNWKGQWQSITPFPSKTNAKWYCSELVATALQKGNIFPDTIVPEITTPSSIYDTLFSASVKKKIDKQCHPFSWYRIEKTKLLDTFDSK